MTIANEIDAVLSTEHVPTSTETAEAKQFCVELFNKDKKAVKEAYSRCSDRMLKNILYVLKDELKRREGEADASVVADPMVVNLGDAGVVPPDYRLEVIEDDVNIENQEHPAETPGSEAVPNIDVLVSQQMLESERFNEDRREERRARRLKRRKLTCPGCLDNNASQKYCVAFGGCSYFYSDDDDNVSSNYADNVLVVDTPPQTP